MEILNLFFHQLLNLYNWKLYFLALKYLSLDGKESYLEGEAHMASIWHNDGAIWGLLAPKGFPDEDSLHTLVEQAPHILPLSGAPRLAIVGREVFLGENYADLIAIEPNGRLVIIEIKLAKNAEARRAVIAQVLTYAAYLRGQDVETLENDILGNHLQKRGYSDLAGLVSANDQQGEFDFASFSTGLAENLSDGRFRLVLVLDRAPDELVKLVGYLESVANGLVIDLITVSSYDVADSQIVVPQRVDPERIPEAFIAPKIKLPETGAQSGEGIQSFVSSIERSAPQHQPLLRRLAEWAASLEANGIARNHSTLGKSGRTTILPWLIGEHRGLVTIWNDGVPYLSLWRSVFEAKAPHTLSRLEQLAGMSKIGQGLTISKIEEPLLELLTEAYREARHGDVAGNVPS